MCWRQLAHNSPHSTALVGARRAVTEKPPFQGRCPKGGGLRAGTSCKSPVARGILDAPEISYYNGNRWAMEWEHGRNLTKIFTMATNTNVISESKFDIVHEMVYTYDAEGIRTGRTYITRIYRYAKNNGGSSIASVGETAANATYSRYRVSSSETNHYYVTQNGKVVRETVISGGVTRVLDYIYDESGRPSSVIFKDGTADEVTYYYVLNLQGDVEQIIDANGVVQAQYTYDPWGKILSITDGIGATVSNTHIGKLNSLRYRGYCSDTETNWYYLQSRYYDPITHRFINADSIASTGQGILGTNMFAYCLNNPIDRYDFLGKVSGDWFETPEEAAKDFGNCYNGQSIASNEEYGTYIYEIDVTVTYYIQFLGYRYVYSVENEKRYTYTAPVHGEKDTIELLFKEYINGHKVVAVAHTHAASALGLGDEIFSEKDCLYAINNDTTSFLITPGGFLKRFNPHQGYNGRTICSDIVHDPNSPYVKRKFLFWELDHTRCANCAY